MQSKSLLPFILVAFFAFLAAHGHFGEVLLMVGYAILIGMGLAAGYATLQKISQ